MFAIILVGFEMDQIVEGKSRRQAGSTEARSEDKRDLLIVFQILTEKVDRLVSRNQSLQNDLPDRSYLCL